MRMGIALSLLLGLGVLCCLSACSFKIEAGYHGQSGRDDRTQTQLVKGGK